MVRTFFHEVEAISWTSIVNGDYGMGFAQLATHFQTDPNIIQLVRSKYIYIYVKLNAIHQLGSSPIGCEDFSIPGSITNGVSV